MAEIDSFTAILDQEFRWPTKGDTPFVESDDPLENDNISDGFSRLVLMMNGYRKAADLMVKAAERNSVERSWLVYPILFNYRHFLELALKYQLATHGPTVGIEPNWNCHRLEILWASFTDMLERYEIEDPDEVDPIVSKIVLEFAKIDPNSYSYRYPVNKKGKPVPVDRKNLHLPTLTDVMDGVAGYLTGCDVYFSIGRDSY